MKTKSKGITLKVIAFIVILISCVIISDWKNFKRGLSGNPPLVKMQK